MKFIQLLSFLVLCLVTSLVAAAPAQSLPSGMTAVPLAAITNDRDTSVSHLNLMLNDQDTVRGIYLATSDPGDKEQSDASGQVYWLQGIESGDGVVLGQGQGVEAIFLRGTIPPRGDRGTLIIKYMSNGVLRHFAECRIGLQRLGPYNWQLVNAYTGLPINSIQVRTWILGISTLSNVCPDKEP